MALNCRALFVGNTGPAGLMASETSVGERPPKFTPGVLRSRAVVTTALPVAAPAGTVTAMLVSLQLWTIALIPLKVTPPKPWDAPNLLPRIVTWPPTGAEPG